MTRVIEKADLAAKWRVSYGRRLEAGNLGRSCYWRAGMMGMRSGGEGWLGQALGDTPTGSRHRAEESAGMLTEHHLDGAWDVGPGSTL